MNFKFKGALLPFLIFSLILHILLLFKLNIDFNEKIKSDFYEISFQKIIKRNMQKKIHVTNNSSKLKNTKISDKTAKNNIKHRIKKITVTRDIKKQNLKINKQQTKTQTPNINKTTSIIKKQNKTLNRLQSYSQNETTTPPEITNTNKTALFADEVYLDSYKSKIIKIISKHIKYPYIAKKRGYEGLFIFDLKINKFGKLISYKIKSEKGNKILKKTAIKSITSINYPKHDFSMLQVEIPIEFKLKN